MLDWVIVGGGVHGTHASLVLTARGVARDRLRVVDPHDEPLARWEECTRNAGMEFLRSPSVHNLDLEPFALDRFSRSPEGRPFRAFRAPYDRPSLDLFREHVRHVVDSSRLRDLRVRARAEGLRAVPGGWCVKTDAGPLPARRVLLALGLSEQPAWPGWAREARAAGLDVEHLFSPGFDFWSEPAAGAIAVVGGGITAAQAATALANDGEVPVILLRRHPLRVHQFDSDPGWLGPLHLSGFRALPPGTERRRAIDAARHRGSVPPDVASRLGAAVRQGTLTVLEAEVLAASPSDDGGASLRLSSGETVVVRHVVLATGFERTRPGGPWLDDAVLDHALPCSTCGYPLVDRSLQWAPGLHVTGPLAELEIGPVARNIAGARMAAERLRAAA